MKISWPLKGIGKTPGIYVTQYWGENPQIYGPDGHNGIDIQAPNGTPLICPHNGSIVYATDNFIVGGKNYGKHVRLGFREDGHYNEIILGHMSRQDWGELPYDPNRLLPTCLEGEVIGYVGNTGYVISNGGGGYHVHLGMNIDNKAVDPLPYMKILIRRVGWNDAEKGFYIGSPNISDDQNIAEFLKTFPGYQYDDTEWNLKKRPWPIMHP